MLKGSRVGRALLLASALVGVCGCGGGGGPTTAPPAPPPPTPATQQLSGSIVAEFDNTNTLNNRFTLTATMAASARIVRATWDLSTSRRRAYFDTCGGAPGVAANLPFTPLNGQEVGLTTSFGPCALDGAQALTLEFQHFDGGERFQFEIDTEDETNEVFVTGANFAGTTVTVTVASGGTERRFTGTFEGTGERTARATLTLS